ncbi:hypothetical protein J2Z21_003388 [Streptomyces griseochromogenes]|uniref:Uncharacterized protein n=1 Tax=Streptomyces griseochromogenes TaxID=68214 RepID=A0A1B1B8H5_9ACTN|nr:hypothetical protein AVL59_41015 [Streptomyces griseochromogenes]MBP2050449.1 hypothetical protein [Streptomyces griseochromogenes]
MNRLQPTFGLSPSALCPAAVLLCIVAGEGAITAATDLVTVIVILVLVSAVVRQQNTRAQGL